MKYKAYTKISKFKFKTKKSLNIKINKVLKNNVICPELGLNQRPLAFQANALPLSYPNLNIKRRIENNLHLLSYNPTKQK